MHLFSVLAWACIAAESVWPHATLIPLVDQFFLLQEVALGASMSAASRQGRRSRPAVCEEEGRRKAGERDSCATKRLQPPEDALLNHSNAIWALVPGNHPPVQ